MRRWETLTALAAVVLASIGSIRAVRGHVALTVVAVALILVVGIARLLEARKGAANDESVFDAAGRAQKIRDARGKRRD